MNPNTLIAGIVDHAKGDDGPDGFWTAIGGRLVYGVARKDLDYPLTTFNGVGDIALEMDTVDDLYDLDVQFDIWSAAESKEEVGEIAAKLLARFHRSALPLSGMDPVRLVCTAVSLPEQEEREEGQGALWRVTQTYSIWAQ